MYRIAIFGAECTGKTTLSLALAEAFDTYTVSEYARAYAEKKFNLDITDVLPIMRGQLALEEKIAEEAVRAGKKMIICDTIPLSSVVYSQYYNSVVPAEAEKLVYPAYALYFLTSEVPWEADKVRGENINRTTMQQMFEQALLLRGLSYVTLSGSRTERLQTAIEAVSMLVAQNAASI